VPRELRGDLEADVVPGRRVTLARIAEADDQYAAARLALAAIGPAAKEGQGLLPAGLARLVAALALAGLLGGGLALLADQLGLLLDLRLDDLFDAGR
jgi:hypothetical protein